jgi:hypothetical protein
MANSLNLNKNINDIVNKIYTNQDLCKLLFYDVENPLSEADILDTTILYTDLTNQRIIPKPFTVDTTDIFKSTLHVVLNNFKNGDDQYFTKASIDFVVMCNVNLWDIVDGSGQIKMRPWMILEELNETFNRERTVGIGTNTFDYGRIIRPNEYFAGYVYCCDAEMFL